MAATEPLQIKCSTQLEGTMWGEAGGKLLGWALPNEMKSSRRRRPEIFGEARRFQTAYYMAIGASCTGDCMQLRIARLCLDCDEVHAAEHCPVCASEAFAYLTRWVPAPERRMRPRPTTSPEADVYRELTTHDSSARGRWLKRGALGVTVITVAGWIWRWNEARTSERRASATVSRRP